MILLINKEIQKQKDKNIITVFLNASDHKLNLKVSRTLGINSGACLGFLNTPKIVFAFSRVKTESLRKKQFLMY